MSDFERTGWGFVLFFCTLMSFTCAAVAGSMAESFSPDIPSLAVFSILALLSGIGGILVGKKLFEDEHTWSVVIGIVLCALGSLMGVVSLFIALFS